MPPKYLKAAAARAQVARQKARLSLTVTAAAAEGPGPPIVVDSSECESDLDDCGYNGGVNNFPPSDEESNSATWTSDGSLSEFDRETLEGLKTELLSLSKRTAY